MREKSVQKRKYIVEKARRVFYEKGYKAVTMKEIVEACEISRGGLYLYFSSPKEIFEMVLEGEYADIQAVLDEIRIGKCPPGERMLAYFDAQKKYLLKEEGNLVAAEYEYMFENRLSKEDNCIKRMQKQNLAVLEQLIREGVEQEWMVCEDAAEAARNIAYTLEGLKVSSQTIGISETIVDREIEYIIGTLGMEIKYGS